MSDDWTKKYLDIHKQRQQEKQDVQKRRHLAEAGGPGTFAEVRERVKRDIHALREVVVFQAVELRDYPSAKFEVVHPAFPRATLAVDFDTILIKYEYIFPPKEGSRRRQVDHTPGTLRICSDLDGNLTVYKNGNGDAFEDVSEVSEFLLKPLLDYIGE